MKYILQKILFSFVILSLIQCSILKQKSLKGIYESNINQTITLNFNNNTYILDMVRIIAVNNFKVKRKHNNNFLIITDERVLKKVKNPDSTSKNTLFFSDLGKTIIELHYINNDSLEYRVTYSKNLGETRYKGILLKK